MIDLTIRRLATAAAFALLAATPVYAATYNIGPGQTYATLSAAPLDTLAPGDTVNIYYATYNEKFLISNVGTSSAPITFHGVPDPSTGALPVINGNGATTATKTYWSSQSRAVVHVGGSGTVPAYIVIENVEIKSARPAYTFKDTSGSTQTYSSSAAAYRVQTGDHITIRNCIIDDSSCGIMSSPIYGAGTGASNLTIEGCYIYNNADAAGNHEVYTESEGITYQYNYFSHQRLDAAGGDDLKDRSSGEVIRYNWLEYGSQQISMVDSYDPGEQGYPNGGAIYSDPMYMQSFVYGNVLIEHDQSGAYGDTVNDMVKYGGDDDTTYYRWGGTLYLYNNTFITYRTDDTAILKIEESSPAPADKTIYVDMRNNICYDPDGSLYANYYSGTLTMTNNWMTAGWGHFSNSVDQGSVTDTGTIAGFGPGFVSESNMDFHLVAGSACINAGTTLADAALNGTASGFPPQPVNQQILMSSSGSPLVPSQTVEPRPDDGQLDIGAFEYNSGPVALAVSTSSLPSGMAGVPYSATLAAYGGTRPYTWSLSSGSLPAGLTLTAATGAITGTPANVGAVSFTAMVADSATPTAATATKALSITVVTGAITITTTSLPAGTMQTAYNQQLSVSGGLPPYTWSIYSGALPAGLSLSSSGIISGTPPAPATANFVVLAADSKPIPTTATQALSISIAVVPLNYRVASDASTTSNASTTYATKVSLALSPPVQDDWLILAFAETQGSNTSYAVNSQLVVDGSVEAQFTGRTISTADWCPVIASKVATFAAGAHTISLNLATGNAAATAYMRNARIVALRKYTLDMTSAAADSQTALTTAISAYVTLSFTPASTGNYVLICTCETPARTNSATTVEAALDGAILDQSAFHTRATSDYYPWASFSVVACTPAQHTLAISAMRGAGAGTLNIRRCRVTAIRIDGDRFDGTYSNEDDSVSTTTSTSYVQKMTGAWAPGSTGDWLLLGSARIQNTNTSCQVQAQMMLDDSTGFAEQWRTPYSTADYLEFSALAVANLTAASHTVDSNFCTSNASGTAGMEYCHFIAIPLIDALPLSVTTTSLPDGQTGSPYDQILSATGGITPYTWTVASGSLPEGLTLSPAGTISGTPTSHGAYAFTVEVSDAQYSPFTATAALSFQVTIGDLAVTTTSLPDGMQGSAYEQSLLASGGLAPYSWTLHSGSLPDGLTLSSSGNISGTPGTQGTWDFTVMASDSQPSSFTSTQELSIAVGPAALSITTTSLPAGKQGLAYLQALAATGGVSPYSWTVSSGALPAGLSLSSDGTISGAPSAYGTSPFTVLTADSQPSPYTATQGLSITIAPSDMTVTTAVLPDGVVATPYSQALNATGGAPPYSWSVSSGALPNGLTLSGNHISGTPSAPGAFAFTVAAADSWTPANTASSSFAINVTAPKLVVTTNALSDATISIAYSQFVNATGGYGARTWSIFAGALPGGLTINPATGEIHGTPTDLGTSSFTAAVADSQSTPDTASAQLQITVVPVPLAISTNSPLPDGVVAEAYSAALAVVGGVSPYTWSVSSGSLPLGLSIDSSTGIISGTPGAAGAFGFTVQVTDSATPSPATATKALSITVQAAALRITTPDSLPYGVIATAYAGVTLTATGGVAPYAWSATDLSDGLTIDSSTGAISGTPTGQAGNISFTVSLQDSQVSPFTDTRSYTINIVSEPSITTSATMPSGWEAYPYSQTMQATGGTLPYSWQVTSGNTPDGVPLVGADVTGTPGAAGTFTFTMQVTDATTSPLTATKSLTIVIAPPDNTGPTVSGLSPVPTSVTHGVTTSVMLSGNASDVSSGGGNISAAEYFLGATDPGQGNGTTMAVATPAQSSSSITATIDVTTWTVPSKVVNVRAKDMFNNWGAPVALTIPVLDGVAPAAVTNLQVSSNTGFLAIPNASGALASDTPSAAATTFVNTWTLSSVQPVGGISMTANPADPTAYPGTWALYGCSDVTGDDKVFLAGAVNYKSLKNPIKGGATASIWQTIAGSYQYVRLEAVTPKTKTGYRVGLADVTLYGPTTNSVTATWTATANDGSDPNSGPATVYDIRYSANPITDDASFAAATQAPDAPTPAAFGTTENFTLSVGTLVGAVSVAVKAGDGVNWSPLASADGTAIASSPITAGTPNDGDTWSPTKILATIRFYYTKSSALKTSYVAFGDRPDFPTKAPAGTSSKVVRVKLSMPSWFAPTTGQWASIKKLTTETGNLYWRLETSTAQYAGLYTSPRHLMFYNAHVIPTTSMNVPGTHAAGTHASALYPSPAALPTFNWTPPASIANNLTGVGYFYIDVSTLQTFPLKDKLHTVVLGKPTMMLGTGQQSYVTVAAEWKKIRQIAANGGGVLYWRVRGTDKTKSVTVAGDAKELFIDGGTIVLTAPQSVGTSGHFSWTGANQYITAFQVQFTYDGTGLEFSASPKYTLQVPAKAIAGVTSYDLTGPDTTKLLAFMTSTKAPVNTGVVARVKGLDADGAFVDYSAAVAVNQ